MKEQQVHIEVVAADIEVDLAADERKPGTELLQVRTIWSISPCSSCRSAAVLVSRRKSKT